MESKKSKKYKILSIDGGGVRGLYPATLLKNIENEINKPLHEVFDLVVGTSVGSIIAATIATGYPVAGATKLIKERSSDIFDKNGQVVSMMTSSKYKSDKLFEIVQELVGDNIFKDLQSELLLTATEISTGEARIFSSLRDHKGLKLVDAIMASSAAPLFFKPWVINDEILADGGVWAKNPSLVGVMEAISQNGSDIKDIKVLSIGTGKKPSHYEDLDAEKLKNDWGVSKWGPGIVNLVSGLQSNEPDYILKNSLLRENYLRLNFSSPKKVRIDAVKAADLEILENEAYNTYSKEKKDILEFLSIK